MISYTGIFSILFLFTTLSSILSHTTLGDLPTTFWWTVSFIMFILVIKLKAIYFKNDIIFKEGIVVVLLLIWNIISITRGLFVAENYWEYKNLIHFGFVLLIPIFVYIFSNKEFLSRIISFWLKYMFIPFFMLLTFITFSDFSGRYLIPILFLLLIFPLLPVRWKIITLILTFFVIFTGFDARSNVIKFSVAFLLAMSYYFRFLLIDKFFKIVHGFLLILPIVLLLLAITNTFNIFKMDDYLKGNYTTQTIFDGKIKEENLTADTRTFIYIEAIESAIKNDYVLFGRTPANGYDSVYFGEHLKYDLGTNKMQRFSSEVSIINIFTWNGLIGTLLYFLVFFISSFLAVYKSNNIFIKVIGLFVAFRWVFSFIEDFTSFDLSYIFIWIFISMCLSNSFRRMSNDDFKNWTTDLLNKSTLFKIRN